MRCPSCGWEHTIVTRVVVDEVDGLGRERKCMKCGLAFETVEQVRAVLERQAWQASLWNVVIGDREGAYGTSDRGTGSGGGGDGGGVVECSDGGGGD